MNYVSTTKQDLLMNSIKKFYNKCKNCSNQVNECDCIYKKNKNLYINELLDVLNNNSKISLRIIDWFVTNYSKKNNISYCINNKQFIVYIDYKLQLKGYSKKQFDPFLESKFIIHLINL